MQFAPPISHREQSADRLAAAAAARILIADDQPQNLSLLARLLNASGYRRVETTLDPFAVVPLLDRVEPDLLILDLHMPGLDGFRLLELMRDRLPPLGQLPVLVVTGDGDPSVRQRALELGARDFVAKPFNPVEVLLRIGNLLEARVLHRQLIDHNRTLESIVRARTRELEEARHDMLERLARAAEYRDDDTGGHARRVGALAARLARALGLPPHDVEMIGRAAPLHDVGKVGIPDAVLLKATPLTGAEFSLVRMHTVIGAEILSGSREPLLRMAEQVARSHHERWDGAGYPAGLSGLDIPLVGRITAVADAFDVMTHARRFAAAMSEPAALADIVSQRGKQFDPAVVDALVGLATHGLLAA